MRNLFSRITGYSAEIRRRRLWMRVVIALACVVVFCTTYALILPAITMETSEFEPDGHVHTDDCYQIIRTEAVTELACPFEPHTHTAKCYDGEEKLICAYADFAVHTHNSYCYDAEENLVCKLPEIKAHTHTEDCYPFTDGDSSETVHIHTEGCYAIETGALLCGQEESAGHFHDESCYLEMDELVCGLEESEEHTHDGNCYMTVSELICPLVEAEGHQHTIDCYEQTRTLVCGFEEGQSEAAAFFPETGAVCGLKEIILHTHEDTCYNKEGELVCGQVEILEHQHTEECLHITEASEERILDCPYASSDSKEEPVNDEEESGDEDGAETSPVYRYEDESVAIEVVLEEDNMVPEGAQLIVQPVTDTTEGYDCELLKEQAEAVVGSPAAQIVFYDISFYTPEGEYIPVTDRAAVTIRYADSFLENAYEVNVLHYKENEAPEVLEDVVIGGDDNGIYELTVQTEGFSVFAVMTLAEEEPTVQKEGTFTLTYSEGGQDYVITFGLEDASENAIPGDYTKNNIVAENATRYIFGAKDSSTAVEDKERDKIAPEVEGYTYIGCTEITGVNKNWNKNVYSVATKGYKGTFGGTVNGFSFYTTEPLSATQFLTWPIGNYRVTLTYAKNADDLNNETFAIVNRTSGDRALTATSDEVNGVNGLKSGAVTVIQDGGILEASGNVTAWTFHSQTDGKYIISTDIPAPEGELTERKYLRLCQVPYSNVNDGRGSLTLVDSEEEASHVDVGRLDNGGVVITSGDSSINLDASNEKHVFWCFNDRNNDNSKLYLCKIAEEVDYSGSWVIVNLKDTVSGVAMQAEDKENKRRAGLAVTVRAETNGTYTIPNANATVWQFERQEDGSYYISTTVTDGDSTEVEKYLTIGSKSGDPVRLEETPQSITVVPGRGENSGKVRLINSAGIAVNLAGSKAEGGFFSYNDSTSNEWHTLCGVSRDYKVVTNTANHPSSVINLFDYWITGQNDKDVVTGNFDEGINYQHTLKFSYNSGNAFTETPYNAWTRSKAVYPGIVKNVLNQNGFPDLEVGAKESLDYLFDPNVANDSRESYRNVSGLLQVDSQGYYYYNSAQNFAEFNKDTNNFTLYDTWGVLTGGSSPNGQFFPFNSMDKVANVKSTDEQINHYLGMTLTTRFVQQYEGHTTSSRSTDTVFNFAGDDDVWIFIDDVLVADLGGIHDRASVSINFSTGDVKVNDESTGTLKQKFEKAGKESEWKDDTFVNNTYHTLKFFYLERGNTDSNLYLQYNLTEIPLTGIYKVNQYGDAVSGASFAVYAADENYNYINSENPLYEGVTNANGEMVFRDSDGMPYSLSELQRMFGDHFILKETKAPENYSIVSDEIHLYIENDLMLCENTYESGVWASSTLQVAAPGTLKAVNGSTIPYYDLGSKAGSNGTLFAVVLKYMGRGVDELTKQKSWSPLYGSDRDGYTIVDAGDDFVGTAINVAKLARQYGNVCFSLSASGAMQLEMSNLPGNVQNYYQILDNEHKGKTQYTVAYYWTSANSLDGANSRNTVRVDADDVTHSFGRVFGATIEVPNLINRLFVQKLNEDRELVNGANFALYPVEETQGGVFYKDIDDHLIKLEADSDGDNQGVAVVNVVNGESKEYVYQVNPDTGRITVGVVNEMEEGEKHYIDPYETAMTLSAGDTLNPSHEEGTATFSGINNGKYYMREIKVPTGYLLNPTEVMVLVAKDAVYANAGTVEDGVTVARGPGYLVKTMSKFASDGDIDNTLRWVYEKMRICKDTALNARFSAYDNEAWKSWDYLKTNNSAEVTNNKEDALSIYLEYAPDSSNSFFNYALNVNRYTDVSSVRRRIYTTEGWSYFELYQDYDYGARHSGVANYTKLVGPNDSPQEIAHLFSRSTYIQVMDKKKEGSLEISKTVNNGPSDDKSYEFTLTLENQAGVPLPDSYSYKIYSLTAEHAVDELIEEGEIKNGETICLKNQQIVVIEKLPAGTKYTVTESADKQADYIISAVRDHGKESVGADTGEKEFSQNVVHGTLYWMVNEDGSVDTTSTVDYTNTYLSDLTIHKVDNTNQKISLSGAEFVLYRETNPNNTKLYYTYTNPSEDGSGETTGKTDWKSLEDGEKEADYKLVTDRFGTIRLCDIANGTYFLKELKAPDGYYPLEAPIKMTVIDGKLTGNYGRTGITISGNGLILTVPNTTGYELPSTGGQGTLMCTICGIALMAGPLMYMLYKRRKGECSAH